MNALPVLTAAAAALRARLLAEPGVTRLSPIPGFVSTNPASGLAWDNLLLSAPRFRRAHVETLVVRERVAVLHVCVFPKLDDLSPIFGFDVVAGPSRVTGLFLDLSPVTEDSPTEGLRDVCGAQALANFAHPRDLPEWGNIFSPDVIAIRPSNSQELSRGIALAGFALNAALAKPVRAGNAAPGQARYVAGQRANPHTLRMLSGLIGPEPALRFVEEVLFPAVRFPSDVGQ